MRKIETIILAVVIVALTMYLVYRDRDRTLYDLPDLPKINESDIDRIEIQKAGSNLNLEKAGAEWRIGPQGYPADSAKVHGILDVLDNLTLTALISESENYVRYDLDKRNRIRVRAWKKKKALRDFFVGKAATTYQHTHILLAKDPNVYHARGDFRNVFDRTAESLEDKAIFDFPVEEIHKLEIQSKDRSVVLVRGKTEPSQTGENATAAEKHADAVSWKSPDGNAVGDSEVKIMLRFLSGMRFEKFTAADTQEAIPETVLTIVGSTQHRLEIYKAEKGGRAYAKSSKTPFFFLLGAEQIENLENRLSPLFITTESADGNRGGS